MTEEEIQGLGRWTMIDMASALDPPISMLLAVFCNAV